uniref:Uncharacterized protein n=1 Tax=Manihot esculenta TaxID=3983 RepID=A0A2C9U5Y5_MANES
MHIFVSSGVNIPEKDFKKENFSKKIYLYVCTHAHVLQFASIFDKRGSSKVWRGDVDWWNPKEMKFYHDGQGFMSIKITQTQVDNVFYDVSGYILHKWSKNKELLSTI